MRKILLDTNAYAAFKKGEPGAVEIIRGVDFIGINVVVLAELLCGFKGGNQEDVNLRELNQFMQSPRVSLIQIDKESAEFYSLIYWNLKKHGKPVPTNDIWVAASALRHGLSLLSYDGHFKHIDGLILMQTVF